MNRVNGKILSLVIIEAALTVTALQIGALLRFGDLALQDGWALAVLRSVVFVGAVMLGLTATGLYQVRQRLTLHGVLTRIIISLGFAATILMVVYFMVPAVMVGRGWWALSLLITALFLGTTRAVFSRVVDRDLFRRRVLVYGAGKRAANLLQLRRRSDQRGFQVVAFLPVPGEERVITDERVDDSVGDLAALARKHDAEEIVIAMDDRRRAFPIRELLDCKFDGMHVIDIVSFLERETGKVKVDLMDPSWIIFADGFTQMSSRVHVFRLLDLVVCVGVLVLAWPFMLLSALAIFIEDGRPILYRQTRVGLQGRNFELLKFRSMYKDAERHGARWAERDDKRVTRVGAVIRKMRIDELPQLLNVLRGEMRFVGPRPERPEFVNNLTQQIPYYHERHCVKPGVTGWAQLSYPYGSSEKDAKEKLQFDLYYVKNQSLLFDLMILLQTLEVVIWGKGAR